MVKSNGPPRTLACARVPSNCACKVGKKVVELILRIHCSYKTKMYSHSYLYIILHRSRYSLNLVIFPCFLSSRYRARFK